MALPLGLGPPVGRGRRTVASPATFPTTAARHPTALRSRLPWGLARASRRVAFLWLGLAWLWLCFAFALPCRSRGLGLGSPGESVARVALPCPSPKHHNVHAPRQAFCVPCCACAGHSSRPLARSAWACRELPVLRPWRACPFPLACRGGKPFECLGTSCLALVLALARRAVPLPWRWRVTALASASLLRAVHVLGRGAGRSCNPGTTEVNWGHVLGHGARCLGNIGTKEANWGHVLGHVARCLGNTGTKEVNWGHFQHSMRASWAKFCPKK
jgi:hypothetical protein